MEFLHLLEKIRIPVLNEFMLLITKLGEETPFLVVAMIIFWCVDKYSGYYVLGVGLFGNMANQFLKILCRIPRPWVRDLSLSPLEDALEHADGYSFPSGHSQTAVGTFGTVAVAVKKNWLRTVCIAIMVLVPFSRMYVGVHTPADVLVGGGMAIAMVFGFRYLMLGNGKKNIPIVFAVMLLCSAAFVAFVEFYPFPADLDRANYESALKNAYTFLGSLAGILVVYLVDEKKLHFTNEAVWWAQILKAVIGLGVVLLVKEGLRSPLETLFAGHMAARAVRYFLIVIVAGVVWPLTFSWFSKLGKKPDALAEKKG